MLSARPYTDRIDVWGQGSAARSSARVRHLTGSDVGDSLSWALRQRHTLAGILAKLSRQVRYSCARAFPAPAPAAKTFGPTRVTTCEQILTKSEQP